MNERRMPKTTTTPRRSLFHAVEVLAGADEKLAIRDRWRRAEVFRVIGQPVDCQGFKRTGDSQHMNVARASDEIDLPICCDR